MFYETICCICLTQFPDSCECKSLVKISDFLKAVKWDKLEEEKKHMRETIANFPNLAKYCEDKINKIDSFILEFRK